MVPTEEAKMAAEVLKVEANALYGRREFKEALAKYSEAITLDDTSAILFANRAACSLEMQKYLDAACDARKATKLDPKYAKAWARLAKSHYALRSYALSVVAWKEALNCYSRDSEERPLTAVEEQLKEACEEGLKRAQEDLSLEEQKPFKSNRLGIDASEIDEQLLPWKVAARMEPDIKRIGPSSAWLVLDAHRLFMHGTRMMEQSSLQARAPAVMMVGFPGVIEHITNALLKDPRVFLAESEDWMERFNRQLLMESQYYGGWLGSSPAEVKEKALKLQQEKGFDASKGALSITVRGWFMRAYMMEADDDRDYNVSLQYYRSALSVLEWGQQTWKDVPTSQRGVIFVPTFVRGIRRFYLNEYLKACRAKSFISGMGLDCEELDKMAAEQIRETLENPPKGPEEAMGDRTFFLAFWSCPEVDALAIRGEIAMHRGLNAKVASSGDGKEHFTQAKEYYTAAIASTAPDEEYRLMYMKAILEAMWHLNEPLDDCIRWAGKIAVTRRAVEKIWTYGVLKKNLDRYLTQIRKYEEAACAGVVEGDFDIRSPASVVDLKFS